MAKALLVLATIPLLISAGCLGAQGPTVDEATQSMAAPGLPNLDVVGHECAMAGAVTLNPVPPALATDVFPAPWRPADTSGYAGLPATGTAIGVWHAAFECENWMVNGDHSHLASGGFVGALVEPPPFDEVAKVDHNFLVATVATRNEDIQNFFKAQGWYVYPGLGMLDRPEDSGTWFTRAVLATAGDGNYESDLALRPEGPAYPVLRMWIIVDGEDGQLHPAYLDVVVDGGTVYRGPGAFFHSGTGDHTGGATAAAVGGLGLADFHFALRFGVLGATVEKMWDH